MGTTIFACQIWLILDIFWIRQLLDAHITSDETSLICSGKDFTFGKSMAAVGLLLSPEAGSLSYCLRDMVVRDKRHNRSKMVDIHMHTGVHTHAHKRTHTHTRTDRIVYVIYYVLCI